MKTGGGEKPDLLSAFETARHFRRVFESKIACVVGLVLVPVGVSLDYFVYPQDVVDFLMLRLACAGFILLIFSLHFLDFGFRRIKILTFLGLLSVQVMICAMIYQTEGVDSTYYAGLNLPILALGILLPSSAPEAIFFCVTTLVLYVFTVYGHPAPSIDQRMLFNNVYFLALTSVISIVAVYFNIQRRFQEFKLSYELDIKNKELAEMDRLKSNFFANVSHELRTPLTLILAPIQDLLETSKNLPSEIVSPLATAHANALRLLKLVNDLLDVIRLEEGKTEFENQPVDISALLIDVIETMEPLIALKNIKLTRSLHKERVIVTGDSRALEKVFFNLLNNAVKFTEASGAIAVRSAIIGDTIVVTIKDTGIGIKAEHIEQIFDRFKQVDSSTTRKYQGTGLGLALVKELVARHAGSVVVHSKYGKGTTFEVSLPLQKAGADKNFSPAHNGLDIDPLESFHRSADKYLNIPVVETQSDELQFARVESNGKAKILVVDDEPEMRKYLVDMLSSHYTVISEANGREGLASAQKALPHLVLLDLMLPEMDGLEISRRLKSDSRTAFIKVVLLTARVNETSKIEALESGADDFLTKPFSSIEIKTRIRNLLRTASLEEDLKQRNMRLEIAMKELKAAEAQIIHNHKINALGSLAAGLLHEINNPLNYTLTAIQLIRKNSSIGAEVQEIVEDVNEGLLRIKTIVSDLRSFADPVDTEHYSPFELHSAIESALNFTAHDRSGIRVTLDVPENIEVMGSKTRIVQVLVNLLTNSVKAIRPVESMREGEISIAAFVVGDRVQLAITDNGVGMSDETKGRIFDPFFSTRDTGQGMGLGLSISHTIIAKHGGQLRVESLLDEGACFVFDLELVKS